LLPHLESLLDDMNDSVKVYALQSAIPLSNRLSEEKVQQHILPPLKAAHKNKTSWRLRFSVAESAAFIAKNMATSAVNSDIVPMYVSLLGDSEAEVRSEASSQLVELASHCSPNMIVSRILPQLKLQLATESS
jgi:serine/threonine-protein phosphatase 2A regulatory subunit A